METQTPTETVKQITTDIAEASTRLNAVKDLPAVVKDLEGQLLQMASQLADIRRQTLYRAATARVRPYQTVSDECAAEIAARFVIHCQKSDKLEALSSVSSQRDALLGLARSTLNITTRAALGSGDVPLPVQYGGEIRELISEFGVARKYMAHYPIGMGTAKPARMGARPSFGSIAMSAAFPEKSPGFGYATLESHKLGGIVRLPRELDEQSFVSMGRFLARFGAIEFARAEDTWAFLADGTGTYENISGIVNTVSASGNSVILTAGKTKPSDATLDDFRALRRKVNKAALNGTRCAYYLDTTWESRLPSFRTQQEPLVYQRLANGTAILDGYPVIWTDVLEPYDVLPSANKPLAVFGALSFWWFGEHGTPRIDTSEHIWFANDQLAVRFIEEIDFDYAAPDAVAVLKTAAA